jgi:L-fuconolactonase
MLTYKEGVEAFRVTDRLSNHDRARLMGESLQRIYNFEAAAA